MGYGIWDGRRATLRAADEPPMSARAGATKPRGRPPDRRAVSSAGPRFRPGRCSRSEPVSPLLSASRRGGFPPRVVRREADDRPLARKLPDPRELLPGGRVRRGHAVDRPLEHQGLRIGGSPARNTVWDPPSTTTETLCALVWPGVATIVTSPPGSRVAPLEGPERLLLQLEEPRRKPAASGAAESHASCPSPARIPEPRPRDQDLAPALPRLRQRLPFGLRGYHAERPSHARPRWGGDASLRHRPEAGRPR
jgi:hypothetical protein